MQKGVVRFVYPKRVPAHCWMMQYVIDTIVEGALEVTSRGLRSLQLTERQSSFCPQKKRQLVPFLLPP